MKLALLLLALHAPSLHARLTVGTYNIRNFDYDERSRVRTDKPALERILGSLNFDLLGVNEINDVAEFQRFLGRRFAGYGVRLSDCGGAQGQHLGFIYNQTKLRLLSFTEDMDFAGRNGSCEEGSRPAAIGTFEEIATGERFQVVQVHLKAGQNPGDMQKRFGQYQMLQNLVGELKRSQKNVLIMGDFNSTGYLPRNQDFTRFNEMVRGAGLTDLTSNLPCSAYWWGGTNDGRESPSLLDHILATPEFLSGRQPRLNLGGHCMEMQCREATLAQLGVSYQGVSDHCPVTAEIR